MSGIRLSDKYGVNPSLMQCYVCGEDSGIALLGRLPKDEQAPHRMCIDKTPCDKCKEYMKQGIIIISVKDGESGNNPYRTGRFFVVKEDAMKKMINEESFEDLNKKRICFMEDSIMDKLGFPRGS